MSYLHLMISLFSALNFFQNSPELENHKMVVLDSQKSSIEILGTTNVNEFSCIYQAKLPSDTLKVRLAPEANMIHTSGARFKLPINNFKCENQMMTADFRALLQEEKHPFIHITLEGIYTNDYKKDFAEVSIELAGVSKSMTVETEIQKDQHTFICEGKPEICIEEFGIEAPEKFYGLIKVNEYIQVKFLLAFKVFDID